MKPKTKKIIIIAAAVLAVAVILCLVFRGSKKTAKGMINRLNVSSDIKKEIISHIEDAKLTQDIEANAKANDCTYEQALALSAAYYLVDSYPGVTDATWQQWKSEILSM